VGAVTERVERMTADAQDAGGILEVGAAGAALAAPGEGDESGDLHVVLAFEGGALVGVMDGLGHGSEAAVASRAAARVLAARPSAPIVDLVQICHEELRRTRGVVMSLARFSVDDAELSWMGVGNVEGILLRADRREVARRETIPARPGVVGYRLPPLRAGQVAVSRGDTLVLATDGLHSGFALGVALERSAQEIADAILARHNRGTDDALVVVVRYLGGAP
jgi:phosphoserine phosphatase RsbX